MRNLTHGLTQSWLFFSQIRIFFINLNKNSRGELPQFPGAPQISLISFNKKDRGDIPQFPGASLTINSCISASFT